MTNELLEAATVIKSKIDELRGALRRIEDWENKWRRMTQEDFIIPDELKEEVTQYVTKVLKERYSKELEELEKEFADL